MNLLGGFVKANLPELPEGDRRMLNADGRLVGVCPHIEQIHLAMELAGLEPDMFFCGWSTNYVSNIGFLSGREGTDYTPARCCYVAALCLLAALCNGNDDEMKDVFERTGHIFLSAELEAAQRHLQQSKSSDLMKLWQSVFGYRSEELDEKLLARIVANTVDALLESITSRLVRPRDQFMGIYS